MILPIVLLTLCSTRQTGAISFTCRAEPMSRLVVDLSKTTGRDLTTSKECANDVLVVSVRDVTIDQLLAEIAKVDSGQWDKRGDTMRFSPNTIARHAEARAETVRQAKIIRAELQKQKSLLAQSGGTDPSESRATMLVQGLSDSDAAQVRGVIDRAVPSGTILDLLEAVDPELLVLQREQRVVLSTHPTASQYPLGSGADSFIENLVEKQNAVASILYAAAVEKAKKAGAAEPSPQGRYVQRIPGYSKADLIVADGGAPGSLDTHLVLYSSEGEIVYESDYVEVNRIQEDEPGPKTTTNIEITDAAKAFRKMSDSQGVGDSAQVAVPPALVPYFTDVEHNDPLALSPSDEILSVARAQGRPLVAVVPDTAFIDTSPVGEPISLEGFLQSLTDGDTMRMTKTGDWIEIKPASPETSRQYRCDRPALAHLMRECMKESFASLAEFSEFAAKADYANNDVVRAYVDTAVSGYGNGGLGTAVIWNLYRVFGEFTPEQRASLASGARLPLSVLNASQLANFTQFGFGALERLRYGTGPAPMAASFPSARPLGTDPQRGPSNGGLPPMRGFETEPTELLPNGVQSSGFIEMKVVEEPFVSPSGPATTAVSLPRVMGVAQMALRQAQSNQPDFGKNGAIRYERFKLGSRKLHLLTIHGSDRAFVTGRLYEFHVSSDSPDIAMGDLPAEWKSELSRRLSVLQQEQTASNRRRAVPPP